MHSAARVLALVGPFGCGKTEIALHLALLRQGNAGIRPVVLADLDVIKPYFRAREAKVRMGEEGVRVLAPDGDLALADLPIVPSDLRAAILDPHCDVILDVGGDPVGARALGSVSDVVRQAAAAVWFVVNGCRPFLHTVESAVVQAHAIADAAHLPITGVVANTHRMDETTPALVASGLELAQGVADDLGVGLRLLAVPEHLTDFARHLPGAPHVLPIRRWLRPAFEGGVVLQQGRAA